MLLIRQTKLSFLFVRAIMARQKKARLSSGFFLNQIKQSYWRTAGPLILIPLLM